MSALAGAHCVPGLNALWTKREKNNACSASCKNSLTSLMHAFDDRPLGPHSLRASEVCPFNLVSRWLASPSEVSANLVSASSAGSESLRHTVKLFGTVKARAFVICITHAYSYLFRPRTLQHLARGV